MFSLVLKELTCDFYLYLHVLVWMVQKGSHFREICTSLRGGFGKFSSEQEPKVVLVDVLNAVKLF